MLEGKIKFYNPDKKFGFIVHPDYPKDVHFSFKECHGWIPQPGDDCSFGIKKGNDGKETAKHVKRLTPAPTASTPCPAGMPQQPATNEKPLPNPYNFVPVELGLAVTDEPIWHDGKKSGERFTGRLSITLTALTPLTHLRDFY